jgi:putative ABC transport system ATP-binding protein
MIQCNNIKKSFVSGKININALRGIDLTIQKGEMVAISGVSGSGKSTLLNIIGGIDRPSSGMVQVDGESITGYNSRKLTSFRAKKVGFIFQNFNLISVLNVYENIIVPMQLKGQAYNKEQVLELIDKVGLSQYISHVPDELSGGQRQRVAIARSLVHNPPYILADEITANLDTATAESIMSLLVDLNKNLGVTFIFASHDQRILNTIDRQVRLRDGIIDPNFTPGMK